MEQSYNPHHSAPLASTSQTQNRISADIPVRFSQVTNNVMNNLLMNGLSCSPPTERSSIQHIQLTQEQTALLTKLINQAHVLRIHRKAFFKMRAKAVRRRKAFRELYTTQASYLKDLILIADKLKKPLVQRNLLSQEDAKKIFSNIDSLVQLHTEVERGFKTRWENYDFYTCVGDFLISVSSFYILYVEFNDSYQKKGYAMLDELSKNSQEAKQIIDDFRQEAHNDVISCLYKLVKRPGSLNMLIDLVLKLTQKEHPDFKPLEQALAKFKKIAKSVDDAIGVIMMSKRMQELDQQFPDPTDPIINPRRKMVTEQNNLWWVTPEKNVPVVGIFFTDLVLLLSRDDNQQKILYKLKWSKTSTYSDLEDGKTRKNMLNLIGQKGIITLTTGDDEYKARQTKQKLIQEIEQYMLDKNRIERVEVKALGTEELNSTSLSKHTIYIMEVKIGSVRQNLYLRFKQVIELTDLLQKKYPQMKFPSLPKKWLTNHKSSTIQTRKIMILETLQTLLNDPNVIENPSDVINALRLKENFYDLPKILRERQKKRQQEEKQKNQESKIRKAAEVSFMDILCATELNLGRYTFHAEELGRRKIKGDEALLEVRFPGGDSKNIRIGEFDTVQDVCNKISLNISLTVNRDFRLFHQIGKKESRALDHDQIVMKMFDFSKKEESGIFSKVKGFIKDAIIPDSRPLLVFKKYYYLPFQKEQQEFRKNIVRLRLMVKQVFAEVKDLKYQLTIDEYAFFGAAFIYIQNEGEVTKIIESKDLDVSQLIEKIIPDLIYKYENINNEMWKEKVMGPIARIDKEISNLRQANLKKLAKTQGKDDNYIKKDIMCMHIIMNKIRSNPLYGSNLYYIQPHDSTAEALHGIGIETAHNMWLAISYQGISLLKPSSKESVFSIKYKDISNKTVYPSSVTFTLVNDKEYRFNTCQSFEISQLVDYNKMLIQTVQTLEKSSAEEQSKLLSKTSFYVSDITGYRNSLQ